GAAGPAAHREMAELIARLGGIDLVITVGHLALHLAGRLGELGTAARVIPLSDLDERQAERAAALLRPGDLVLLKGSRRVRLERLVAALKSAHAPGTRAQPAPAVA
ncbi:MAG TPA: hypothetical protein VD963_09555, partial [Phycisphaerales bacterium]|nr:hypothetical protein [Phycisphaerales bacterium]